MSKHTSMNYAKTLSDILGEELTQEDAVALISQDFETYQTYLTFPEDVQQNILAFIRGQRGLPITYDSFFKKIMDPGRNPERLEHFLSAILGQEIHIHSILPREGTKLSNDGSLVIMDIVVQGNDGAIINVEMQKIGYLFPGERTSCYASDFIMRQYNKIKNERREKFTFKDMKPVYIIVLMESSSANFKEVSPIYIHREQTSYDSGAIVTSLSQIIYVSLDTFHSVVQTIDSSLDAWLTFLSSDKPADIIRLVTAYPEFEACYRDIISFRKRPEVLINMYSEALAILDRNTTLYMCEEMKKELEENKSVIAELDAVIAEKESVLAEKESAIAEKESTIAEKESTIAEKDALIAQMQAQLEELKRAK